MPTYKISDPQTGKTIRVTGDAPPSEQELGEIFTRISPPKQQSLLSRLGHAVVDPAIDYGKMVGEAGIQAGRAVANPAMRQQVLSSYGKAPELSDSQRKNLLSQRQTFLMKPEELSQKPSDIMLQGVKRTVGAQSYFAPGLIPGAGAGASVGARALVGAGRGAVAGGMGGFARSKRGEELKSTAVGTGTGAVLGGLLGYAGAKLSDKAGQLKASAAQTLEAKELQPTSKTAARTLANIFHVSKRKATRDLDPVRTAEQLLDLGDPPPLKSLPDLAERSSIVTGRDGVLTGMVDDAVKANDQQIPWGSVTDAAKAQMKNKIGFDKNAQSEVLRTMTEIAPTGEDIQTMSASQALDYERTLAEQAAAYKRAWLQNADPKMETYYRAYQSASQEAKRLLDVAFRDSGLIDQVKSPEKIATLNQAWPGLGDRVAKATTLGQLRTLQAPFVNANKLILETVNQSPQLMDQIMGKLSASALAGLGLGSVTGPLGYLAGGIVGQSLAPSMSGVAERVSVPLTMATAQAIQRGAYGGAGAAAQQAGAGILNALSGGLSSGPAVSTAEKMLQGYVEPQTAVPDADGTYSY